MSLGTCFYVLLLIALLGGAYTNRAKLSDGLPSLVVWLLFLVVGWKVFGAPIAS